MSFYALFYLNKYRNKLLKGKGFELKYFKNRGIKLELAKFYLPLHSQCPDGEMVDALVSGASAERRVGSSPILGTTKGGNQIASFCCAILCYLSPKTPFCKGGLSLRNLIQKRAHQNFLHRKIVNDEIIFVQSKATKAEHSRPM